MVNQGSSRAPSITTLGCDLSLTASGLVAWRNGKCINRQLITSGPEDGTRELRIARIVHGACAMVTRFEPVIVGIEGYAFAKEFGGEALAEIHGVLKHYLHMAGVPFGLIPPKSLQLFALDYGGYTREEAKPLMVAVARAEGVETYDDNIADAYFVAKWAATQV